MKRMLVPALALSALSCHAAPSPVPEPPPRVEIAVEAGFLDVPPRDVSLKGQSVHLAATAHLFYNLRPADEDPAEKPIFFLFNGFAAEVVRAYGTGPTTVAEGGPVVANPASLTKIANLVYIDPRQAGFSYDTLADRPPALADCAPSIFNEYVDAADVLYAALLFLEKHPELHGPVHWVAESYAGVRATWILAYLRDRWELASYQDPALKALIAKTDRKTSLRAGQVLLQPWLAGKAHDDAIGASCYDAAQLAAVSKAIGMDCAEASACSCANDHDRSQYNFAFTIEHQKAREYEASEAHVIPARAEALFGLPLTKIPGLAAADRGKGFFKCSPPDQDVPPEDEIEELLGALPAGQFYYAPYSPLLPGKENGPPELDWRMKNYEGVAFLDNLHDVPTFVTDGQLDLVVPERALAPALGVIAGADRIDTASAGKLGVQYPDGERFITVRPYPGAGHMITMLEAAALSKDVTAWLAAEDP